MAGEVAETPVGGRSDGEAMRKEAYARRRRLDDDDPPPPPQHHPRPNERETRISTYPKPQKQNPDDNIRCAMRTT